MNEQKNNLFLIVVGTCYTLAIALSFARIYFFHAYPTFLSEDDMPGAWEALNDIPALLTP